MKIKNIVNLTKKAQAELLKNEGVSKSSKIKTLFEAGLGVKEIAELLNPHHSKLDTEPVKAEKDNANNLNEEKGSKNKDEKHRSEERRVGKGRRL